MTDIYKVGKKKIDGSKVTGGVKFDAKMSEKSQTIFKALDGKLKGKNGTIGSKDNILDKDEIAAILNFLREIAGKDKKLGKKEFQRLLKDYGLEGLEISKEEFGEFLEEILEQSGAIEELEEVEQQKEIQNEDNNELNYEEVADSEGNVHKVPKSAVLHKGTDSEIKTQFTVDSFGTSLVGVTEQKDGTKITNTYISENDYEFNLDENPSKQVIETENEVIETEQVTKNGKPVIIQKRYIKGENDAMRQILEDVVSEEGRTITEYDEKTGKIVRSENHQYTKNDDGSIEVSKYVVKNYDEEGNLTRTTIDKDQKTIIDSKQLYKNVAPKKAENKKQSNTNKQLESLGVDVENKGEDAGKKTKFSIPSTETNGNNLINGWQRTRVYNADSQNVSSDDWKNCPKDKRVEIDCSKYKNVKELAKDLFWQEGFEPDNSPQWQARIRERAIKICKDWNVKTSDGKLNIGGKLEGKHYLEMALNRPKIQYVQKYAPPMEGTILGDVKNTNYQVVKGNDDQLYYVDKTTKKLVKPEIVKAEIAHSNSKEFQEAYVYDGKSLGGGTVKIVMTGETDDKGNKIGIDKAGHRYIIMSSAKLKASDLIGEETAFANKIRKSSNQTVAIRIDNEDGINAYSKFVSADSMDINNSVSLMRNVLSDIYEEICNAENTIHERDKDLQNQDSKKGNQSKLNQKLDAFVDALTFPWNMSREEVLAKLKAEGDKIYKLTNTAYNLDKNHDVAGMSKEEKSKWEAEQSAKFIQEYEKIFGKFDPKEVAKLFATGSNAKLINNINTVVNTEKLQDDVANYISAQDSGIAMIKETPKYVAIGAVAGVAEGITGGGATPFIATVCASTILDTAEELLDENKEFDVKELVSKIVMDTAMTYGPIKGYQIIEKGLGEALVKKAISRGLSEEIASALKSAENPLELLKNMVSSGQIADKTIIKLVKISPAVLAAETVAFDTAVGAGTELATTGEVSADGVIKYASISAVAQGMFLGGKNIGKRKTNKVKNEPEAGTNSKSENKPTEELATKESKSTETVAGDKNIVEPVISEGATATAKTAENIAERTQAILDAQQGKLYPHEAKVLIEHIENNLKTVEEIEQFIVQLKKRVGTDSNGKINAYKLLGKDYAEEVLNVAEKRLNKLKGETQPTNKQPITEKTRAEESTASGEKKPYTKPELEYKSIKLSEDLMADTSKPRATEKPATMAEEPKTAEPAKIEVENGTATYNGTRYQYMDDSLAGTYLPDKPVVINAKNATLILPDGGKMKKINLLTDELTKDIPVGSSKKIGVPNIEIKRISENEFIVTNAPQSGAKIGHSPEIKSRADIVAEKANSYLNQAKDWVTGNSTYIEQLNNIYSKMSEGELLQELSILREDIIANKKHISVIETHLAKFRKNFRKATTEINENSIIKIGNTQIDLRSLKSKLDAMNDGDYFRIGREVAGQNDIVINDKYVSREHLVIYKKDGKLYIHDTSSNGTKLNWPPYDNERVFKPSAKDNSFNKTAVNHTAVQSKSSAEKTLRKDLSVENIRAKYGDKNAELYQKSLDKLDGIKDLKTYEKFIAYVRETFPNFYDICKSLFDKADAILRELGIEPSEMFELRSFSKYFGRNDVRELQNRFSTLVETDNYFKSQGYEHYLTAGNIHQYISPDKKTIYSFTFGNDGYVVYKNKSYITMESNGNIQRADLEINVNDIGDSSKNTVRITENGKERYAFYKRSSRNTDEIEHNTNRFSNGQKTFEYDKNNSRDCLAQLKELGIFSHESSYEGIYDKLMTEGRASATKDGVEYSFVRHNNNQVTVTAANIREKYNIQQNVIQSKRVTTANSISSQIQMDSILREVFEFSDKSFENIEQILIQKGHAEVTKNNILYQFVFDRNRGTLTVYESRI